MELTKKSKQQLWRQFNGTGIIFLKLSDTGLAVIEFNQGRNGKFYTSTNHPTELAEYLYGIISEIEDKE